MISRKSIAKICIPVLAILMVCSGCQKKEPAFEVISLKGKVEKIERHDADSGRITMSYYSEKHGKDMLGEGEVTAETEILINGAAATLADIREGDRVRSEVRVEKKGDRKYQTAIKIYIDRAKPIGG